MTTVSSTTSNTSSSAAATTSSAAQNLVDYNSFLKLLVTQMKSQDPTNPTDSTEWVSQLATFSNVEQSVQMNSKLGDMLSSQALSNADSFIGRNLTSADGTVSGTVTSVLINGTSSIAYLNNGAQITLGDGVTVS